MSQEIKKQKGCLFWGCLTLSCICFIAVIGVVIGIYSINKGYKSIVSDKPQEIAIYKPSKIEEQSSHGKIEKLKNALTNESDVNLSFSDEEINTIISTNPHLKELKGKISVKIEAPKIILTGSIPINIPNNDKLKNKFFNGKIGIKINKEKGEPLTAFITDAYTNGKKVNFLILNFLRKTELVTQLRNTNDPKIVNYLSMIDNRVEELHLKEDTLNIKLKRPNNDDTP